MSASDSRVRSPVLGAGSLRYNLKDIADAKIGETANAKHANTPGGLCLLRPLSTCPDRPKITLKVGFRHANSIVTNGDLTALNGNLDFVSFVTGINAVPESLNPDCIHRVLDILTDESERRLINLLRDRAQHALEIDSDFE